MVLAILGGSLLLPADILLKGGVTASRSAFFLPTTIFVGIAGKMQHRLTCLQRLEMALTMLIGIAFTFRFVTQMDAHVSDDLVVHWTLDLLALALMLACFCRWCITSLHPLAMSGGWQEGGQHPRAVAHSLTATPPHTTPIHQSGSGFLTGSFKPAADLLSGASLSEALRSNRTMMDLAEDRISLQPMNSGSCI